MNRTCLYCFILGNLALPLAFGEEKPKTPEEGHSIHGEVFNEGPRQAAVLIDGTGDIHFPVSTKSKQAQQFFDQGIGQLHGFWDFEAERSFRQAAMIDPDCAMAYWGMAMANFANNTRGKGFMDEATKRRDKASEIEQLWIDGLAAYFKDPKADSKKRLRDFVRSIERITEKYPDDIEAKAFLFKQIYYNHRKGHPITSHYTVNLLGKEIFTADPDHPAHHYVIHLWDREKADNALKSAAALGPAGPGIAHMWHMPGHIYSKLKRYHDGAYQQEASARVDHAHMIKFQLIPDRIHNFAHNNEWLIRNLDALGRADDAVSLARNMASLPRKAKFKKKDDDSTYDPSGSSWGYGRQRLKDTLFRFERWEELLALENDPNFAPDEKSLKKTDLQKYFAIAKFETGDAKGGQVYLDELSKLLAEEKKKQSDAMASAEKKAKEAKKKEKDIETAKKSAEKNFTKKIAEYETRVNEITVYASLNADPQDLKKAEKLLPDLKNLSKARHASLWLRAGFNDRATNMAKEAVEAAKNEVHPLALNVQILHAAGKTEEAKKAFTELRTVAADGDAALPIFQRLAPIAKEFGFPEKWQLAHTEAKDLGKRPPLDSLGPFRWSPPSAPDFALPDYAGNEHTLSERSGKATLVIFYLGKGCPHCMEQLNEFGPAMEKYRAAGIEIIAISSDTPTGLAETFAANTGEETANNPFPFPLLSDSSLAIFKKYRAYDDFEKQALHGTFLIDGKKRIRWQNISFEPFMYSDWLLEECQRLLALD